MKTLHLTLKKKFFDMIASGEKKEEYREIKPYWNTRFSLLPYDWCTDIELFKQQFVPHWTGFNQDLRYFDTITFSNGYGKNAPKMIVEFKGIEIGKAKPEWSDNWQGDVFIIKLGKILHRNFQLSPSQSESTETTKEIRRVVDEALEKDTNNK